jgi:hypothetical protein
MSDNPEGQEAKPARVKDDPDALLERVDALWRKMNARLDGWTEQELAAPGLVGDWSGTILIAHLGRWTMAANDVIRDHLAGHTPTDYDHFEPWNQRWAAEDASLTLAEAKRRWEFAHEEFRALARSIPADRWDETVRGWVRGSGIHHLEAHMDDLKDRAASS